jgi:hypothetical protein
VVLVLVPVVVLVVPVVTRVTSWGQDGANASDELIQHV